MSSSSDSVMLREALAAYARGWVVIPLNGKRPLFEKWQKSGMPTLEQVAEWAAERNVGALTGSASGFVVIDDDTEDLSAAHTFDLPTTVTVITGSGKRHYYFKAPKEGLRNSVGKLAEGIDVRADGGQIVLPGSTHPDTGELYRWLDGHDPDSIEMASFPIALMDRLRPKRRRQKVTAQGQLEQRALEILREACVGVRNTAEGKRNDSLNRAAFTAGGLVGAAALELGTAWNELRDAGVASGLDADEIDATIRSGIDAGQAQPFDRAELLASAGVVLQDPEAERPDPPRDASGRPEILLVPGELPKIATECERVILGRPKQLVFQRGGMLVRIVRADPVSMRDVQDATPGRLQTVEVTQDWLRTALTAYAAFYRLDKKSGEYCTVDCPTSVAKVLLELRGSWKFPSLLTITNAPTLRTDGTVVETPGYDRATTIYFDAGNVEFPKVPDAPTRDDALEALAQLKYLLKDFPFETDADRAVILAAILTALIRPALRAAPLFGISAPKMASGKSLLADIISLIATGRVGQAMPQGKDEDEDRKRLLAVLKEGEPLAVLDNVERPLGGGAMCAALTQETYRDRILGSSRTVVFPTCVTWIATGNNLMVEGDMTTRVLISRLDARVERPEERKFDIDPRRYVTEHRGRLVVAGLTVLRAYFVAGRPAQDIPQLGRFEDFSDIVRASLVWVGEADACEVRKRIEDADPERQIHVEIMVAWVEIFSCESLRACDVIQRLERGQGGLDVAGRLRELLAEVASGPGGAITTRRLGTWLASKRDRIEGGMRIVQNGHLRRSALWAVVAPEGADAAHRSRGEPEQTHKDSHTHTPSADLSRNEADECESVSLCESETARAKEVGGARGAPIAPDDAQGVAGKSGDLAASRPNRAHTATAMNASEHGWPSCSCFRCRAGTYWRLKDDGAGQPGEPRCARCYPRDPSDGSAEFYEVQGGSR